MGSTERKIVAGDRASANPTEIFLPKGVPIPPFPGDGREIISEIMRALGQPKANPDELVLSRAGAEQQIRALARNHLLDVCREKTTKKSGWKNVRAQLNKIDQAAGDLHLALGSTSLLTAMALLRTGCQQNTQEWLHCLKCLKDDVAKAMILVPESNCGDAVTELVRYGTANEMLVLGCQNILFACGQKNVGGTVGGQLENLSRLVKQLALGDDCPREGIPAALKCKKMKGRSKSTILQVEALWLVAGDVERRCGTNSDLSQRVQKEIDKVSQGIST